MVDLENLDFVFLGGELWRNMRRRPAEYRRPVRRRLSQWIWALIGMFLIAGLVLFVFLHNHHEDQVNQPIMVRFAYILRTHFLFFFLCPSNVYLISCVSTNLIFNCLVWYIQWFLTIPYWSRSFNKCNWLINILFQSYQRLDNLIRCDLYQLSGFNLIIFLC
jgi:hypothetical protein